MAEPVLKAIRAGAKGPPFHVKTAVAETDGKIAKTFTFEGDWAAVAAANGETEAVAAVVTDGHHVESVRREPDGDGMGKLVIDAVYDPIDVPAPAEAVRTTLRIAMEEVQYDLEDHPDLASERETILKWLATDEAVRSDGGAYYWQSPDGAKHAIVGAKALQFIAAYMAGIKQFVRYYPVVERISTWKKPPGMTQNGRSYTGGTPKFSSGLGGYNDPPVALAGYPAGNWFKSGDGWEQNMNRTWTRKEQWTYTPESKTSAHSWIYNTLGTVSDGVAQQGGAQ